MLQNEKHLLKDHDREILRNLKTNLITLALIAEILTLMINNHSVNSI